MYIQTHIYLYTVNFHWLIFIQHYIYMRYFLHLFHFCVAVQLSVDYLFTWETRLRFFQLLNIRSKYILVYALTLNSIGYRVMFTGQGLT